MEKSKMKNIVPAAMVAATLIGCSSSGNKVSAKRVPY
jgi:hypothetical protein